MLLGRLQGKPVGLQADWARSGQASGIMNRQYNFKASLWNPELTEHFQSKPSAPKLVWWVANSQSSQCVIWQHHTKSIRISMHMSKQNPASGSCTFLLLWHCVSEQAGRGTQTCSSPQSCLTMLYPCSMTPVHTCRHSSTNTLSSRCQTLTSGDQNVALCIPPPNPPSPPLGSKHQQVNHELNNGKM